MKAGDLTDPVIEGLVTGRQRLQREHFATLLRPDSAAVGGPLLRILCSRHSCIHAHHRRTHELFHRPGLEAVIGQVAILRIPFQQPLPLQVPADAPR
jgi:hypothetical protein